MQDAMNFHMGMSSILCKSGFFREPLWIVGYENGVERWFFRGCFSGEVRGCGRLAS